MNERILELYKQAHVPNIAIDPSNNMHYQTTSFSAEKFAELIIQECITLMDEKIEEFDDLAAAGDDEFIARSVGAYQIKELIEDHFGIEE